MTKLVDPGSGQWITLGRVLLAMLLGGLLGFERELASKPAGLRTHMLVAGAAALLVSLGDVVVTGFAHGMPGNVVRSDPIRIIEAVIAGVSFLGAGTIMRRGGHDVEGLTTAASILLASGVGLAVALSQVVLAAGVTVLGLVTLRVVGRLS
jgi:putative Mg2+ transporter-C (MgtC) family protein